MTLHEKLIELRKAVPYAQQDATGYQYEYVSGTALLAILRPKMDELGVLLIPSTGEYTWTEIIKETKEGKKSALFIVTLDMTMTWVNAEKPEEKIEVPFSAFGAQDDISKAFGSALTYSERYFLLKFFNIPTDKLDPDSFQEKTKPKVKSATKVQEKAMFKAAKESGWPKGEAEQYLIDAKGIQRFADLDSNEAEALTDYFKRTPYEKSDGPPGQGEEPENREEKDAFRDEWINLRDPGLATYIHTPGNKDVIRAALERWPDLEVQMIAKWAKLYPETPWPLAEKPQEDEPGDNPEIWIPNDALQNLFKSSGIGLKHGGNKIRQYMASAGLTGDEVEAKLVRLGIYTSATAWKTLSDKVFITGEEL